MSATSRVAGLSHAPGLRPTRTLQGAYGQIASARFADDRTLVAIAGSYVHLVDATTGASVRSVVDARSASDVHIAEGGATFVFLDRAGTLSIRRRTTFDSRDEIAGDRRFDRLAIDAAATLALTACRNTGAIVDLVRGSVTAELVGHRADMAQERGEAYDAAYIADVAMSGDGRIAVTGSTDATAIVWDVATAKAAHVLAGHDGTVTRVAIDRAATAIATIDIAGDLRTWTAGGRPLLQHRFPSHACAIAFDPTGTRLAVMLEDGTLAMLSRRTNASDGGVTWWQPTRTYRLPKVYPYSIALSFDTGGATIAAAWPRNIAEGEGWLDDSAIALVSLETGEVRDVRVEGTSLRSIVLEESDRGTFVFGAVARPLAWDLAGESEPERYPAWPPIFDAAISPHGDVVAATAADGSLNAYDLAGTLRAHFAGVTNARVYAWSRTGDLLAAIVPGATNDTVRVFGADGTPRTSWALARGACLLAFAPDGAAIVGAGAEIASYAAHDRKKTWRIARPFSSCAFARAGNAFFVTYGDEAIAMYDLTTGARLASFDDGRVVSTISAHADGSAFVTTGYDGARLWSVSQARVVARFDELLASDFAGVASFTSDGKRVVFGLGNARDGGCASVYDLPEVR